jgi:hypothetical protein
MLFETDPIGRSGTSPIGTASSPTGKRDAREVTSTRPILLEIACGVKRRSNDPKRKRRVRHFPSLLSRTQTVLDGYRILADVWHCPACKVDVAMNITHVRLSGR